MYYLKKKFHLTKYLKTNDRPKPFPNRLTAYLIIYQYLLQHVVTEAGLGVKVILNSL